ncbi:aromatic-ring-hydroxylating dioxygenase subunit beta [Pseudonocardia sp. GCM10023141]|uniref:aromatic-ring-hydroxylating dioxygenase subunit beta n=1 Tax=Pseudonocardia sp. GCM10023141 TaxID=3252653 RepID=UPI0036133581
MADLKNLPVRDSRYFDEGLYEQLRRDAALWSTPEAVSDSALVDEVTGVLHLESRLLDEGRFEEWLDMFDDECVYWVPSAPMPGDPARTVSLALDDRRRLEDRIVWLRSAYIWSQIPRSKTVRLLTNIEAMRAGNDIVTRANFVLHDVRGSAHATHFGWYFHRFDGTAPSWRIKAKHIRLVESDLPHDNMSIIF